MRSYIEKNPLKMYFILAFGFTWLVLGPGVASSLGLLDFEFEGTVLTILGGVGPLLAAIIVTGVTEGRIGISRIFRSMFTWKIKFRWWAASVLLLAGFFALATGFGILTGGSKPASNLGIYLNGGNLILVMILLLIGSFGEEPGWRGFALPRLQNGRSPMKATFILTIFWWIWHLPTYWTLPLAMDAVHKYGFFAAFGIQFIVLLLLSILCTWVYNGSGGSVLMPVLLHASWNFWSGAFGQDAAAFMLPLLLLTAILVSLLSKNLRK